MSTNGKRVTFGKPMIGPKEIRAVTESLSRKQLTNAGLVRQFEERFQLFTGGRAVAVSSCTAALHIACLIHFKPGDEVIVPALTHVSTAHAVTAVNAIPVFADVEEDGNVSRETIEPLITPKTKGIIVVHYLGKPVEMRGICALAKEKDLFVIEDCALALGAFERSHVGLLGDAGCFSFYPAKHITTGEGGMLLTKNSETAERAEKLRAFGQIARHGDVTMLGFNYRMTEMQAALGLVQMDRLEGFLETRAKNYAFLRAHLPSSLIPIESGGAHYGLSVYLPEITQQDMLYKLSKHMIEASVYYPNPVPSLSFYYEAERYPNAEKIACRTVCLPVGPHLDLCHLKHMIRSLHEILSPSSVALAS